MVTTPVSSSSKPLGPLLPLAGLVLALAVAVGVWMLPDGMVDPASRAIVPRPPQSTAQVETWDPIQPNNWQVLTANFEALREPDRVVERPEPERTDETPQVIPQSGGRLTRPPWSYEGLIREPRGVVAVIRTERGQRLVYVGDSIGYTDPRTRNAVYWVVEEATADSLALTHEGERHEYQMLRVGTNEMPGRGPSRARNGNTTPRPAVPPQEVGEG